ncbi:unnamed protein product, partial [Protopolystoma xenopodis]
RWDQRSYYDELGKIQNREIEQLERLRKEQQQQQQRKAADSTSGRVAASTSTASNTTVSTSMSAGAANSGNLIAAVAGLSNLNTTTTTTANNISSSTSELIGYTDSLSVMGRSSLIFSSVYTGTSVATGYAGKPGHFYYNPGTS